MHPMSATTNRYNSSAGFNFTVTDLILLPLADTHLISTTHRARQIYKNISMLFLFPVKYSSAGVNAQRLLRLVVCSLETLVCDGLKT